MGGVEFHAIQCAHCGLYQVQQVKKKNQFNCTVCRKRQKLQKEHFRGPAKHCREVVQCLNKARHEGEIAFTPIPVQPDASENCAEKRKSESTVEINYKRHRDATSTMAGGTARHGMSSADEDLSTPGIAGEVFSPSNTGSVSNTAQFVEHPPRTNKKELRDESLSETRSKAVNHFDDDDDIFDDVPSPERSLQRVVAEKHDSSQISKLSSKSSEQQLRIDAEKSEGGFSTTMQSRTAEILDDDDDIFEDIPSPPNSQKDSVSENHYSTRSSVQKSSPRSSEHLLRRDEIVAAEEVPDEAPEEESVKNDPHGSLAVSRAADVKTTGEVPDEVICLTRFGRRASPAKVEAKRALPAQEAWRGRCLNKLAKFQFDIEGDPSEEDSAAVSISAPALPMSVGGKTFQNLSHEHGNTYQAQLKTTQSSPETPERPEDFMEEPSSSPGGGRDRFLATLEKFKRTPTAKQKL